MTSDLREALELEASIFLMGVRSDELERDLTGARLPEPPAARRSVCDEVASALRSSTDPATGNKIAVERVERVYDKDARGMCEVLFRTKSKEPMTAWVRGRAVVYLEEGW